MKVLIHDSKWLGNGRAVSAGEVREDLTEDEVKLLRSMNACTVEKGAVAYAEEKLTAAKVARETAATKPAKAEKAAATA